MTSERLAPIVLKIIQKYREGKMVNAVYVMTLAI